MSKVEWEDLSQENQIRYLQKAKYLIEYNYTSGDIEEIAKKIYEKEKQ